jgi:hypothetical protein
MLTSEQQEEYARLSSLLQSIGQRYFQELPHATVTLVLTVNDRRVLVEAYDRMGRKLGDVPNEPDENVVATVANPLRLSANSQA